MDAKICDYLLESSLAVKKQVKIRVAILNQDRTDLLAWLRLISLGIKASEKSREKYLYSYNFMFTLSLLITFSRSNFRM